MFTARRIAPITTLLGAILILPLAPPVQAAQADPSTITATRSGVAILDLTSAELVANAGDSFTLTNASNTTIDVFDVFGTITAGGVTCPSSAKCAVAAGTSQVFLITQIGSIAAEFQGQPGSSVVITMTLRPAPPPPDVLQQVGKPTAGCATFNDPALNLAGVDGGGWSESWAMWMNGGTGGSVCTRTLSFSTNLNRWIVRT
jgi:hypothetical protein